MRMNLRQKQRPGGRAVRQSLHGAEAGWFGQELDFQEHAEVMSQHADGKEPGIGLKQVAIVTFSVKRYGKRVKGICARLYQSLMTQITNTLLILQHGI